MDQPRIRRFAILFAISLGLTCAAPCAFPQCFRLPTANTVDRYVAYLRAKLGPPQVIHTVRGVGFQLRR